MTEPKPLGDTGPEPKPLQVRSSDAIEVAFDPNRCAHAGECLLRAPGVFNLRARPWIQPQHLDADRLADVIHRCPSGALTYRRLDGGPSERPDAEVTFKVQKNGPIHVRGMVEMVDGEGQPFTIGPRAALCRCGHSENKPFCDGSHRQAGFRDG
jgi:uncharacterized Fe-S cluster protein YjdI